MMDFKRMDLKKSILFFGIPGLWLLLNFELVLPMAMNNNLSQLYTVIILMSLPIVCMFTFIMFLYKKSGLRWEEFFYSRRLSIKEILVCVGLFFVIQVLELLTSMSRPFMARIPLFQASDYYPNLFKPDYAIQFPIETFMGQTLSGNYMIILFWGIWLLINIIGEEVLWRGFALKRMELHFGKWAWLVNGLLWNVLFHMFMRWSFISLLPISLILPWICQKTKSFWPGVIIHGIGNLILYVMIISSVFSG